MMSQVLEAREACAKLPKLNLGAGFNIAKPEEGWVNLDLRPLPGIDIVQDMTQVPWKGKDGEPIPDGAFGFIDAIHILEHIPHQVAGSTIDGLVLVMNECYRVLAPGGRMRVEVPAVQGQGAFQDPTHCRYFVQRSMWYFARPREFVPGTDQYAHESVKRYTKQKVGMPWEKFVALPENQKVQLREEAVRWTFTEEGKGPEWQHGLYGSDYGVKTRFNMLQEDYDVLNDYITWILEKPVGD